MPHIALALTTIGIAVGCFLHASKLVNQRPVFPKKAATWNSTGGAFASLGAGLFAHAFGLYWLSSQPLHFYLLATFAYFVLAALWVTGTPEAKELFVNGIGGAGGSATVKGIGIAIGGPGGRAGTHGRGGDGGGGFLEGVGLVAGGEGGHSGEAGVWKPPARSGYEIAMRRLGLPVDPSLAQYGRGGTSPGWYERLEVVTRIRNQFLSSNPVLMDPAHIRSVPLDHINLELEAQSIDWRVRIVDDQFEFFIPQ